MTTIRNLVHEPSTSTRPAIGWKDVAFGTFVGFLEIGAVHLVLNPSGNPLSSPELLVVGTITALLVTIRRQRPLLLLIAAMCLAASSILLLPTVQFASLPLYVVLVLSYAVARWDSGRNLLLGAASVGIWALIAYPLLSRWSQRRHGFDETSLFSEDSNVLGFGSPQGLGFELLSAANLLAVVFLPIVLGYSFRHFHKAQLEQVMQAQRDERMDMARELHDSVAHHMTAIAVQANAGKSIAETQPGLALEHLDIIAKESSATLLDMRRIVAALRRDGQSAPTRAGMDELLALIASEDSGLEIRPSVKGDLSLIPDSIANGLCRVVQESITNARRHSANASWIKIDIMVHETKVSVKVVNDGDSASTSTQGGFGIIGMSERIALLGGSISALPHGDSGWVVQAEIPISETQ